jgi:rhamnosyltransferase
MVNVYIAGCRGVPMGYGGYESFVDKLVTYQQNGSIQYHIACLDDPKYEQSRYKNALCIPHAVPRLGPLTMVLFDLMALKTFVRRIRAEKPENPVVYVLTCRIGPFFGHYVRQLRKLGAVVCLNPDGHEWKRKKWSAPVRAYWKLSERLMVTKADLNICDSREIERYIREEYKSHAPKTTFIAYGADVRRSEGTEEAYRAWCASKGVAPDDYYLVVGRFVPENNYETAIREFMASKTKRKLVLLTNAEENAFMRRLRKATGFDKDPRIVFAGTVYEAQLVKRIREGAIAYIHGHEVGGTNPSLLEALASTPVNLLIDVPFNREVGQDAALYFSKAPGSLGALIDQADTMPEAQRGEMAARATNRIITAYASKDISARYEALFTRITDEEDGRASVGREGDIPLEG